ncbi:Bug family tripartite tricarboxylate transporter substrate binding protein [Delftia sp. WSY_7]|uniref:Bug family tripartite tricarboxylate transporter substrate binding protein n=1 Tax=Delftia sp. WSY_7 TaxID=3367202 RepID=UPI003709F6CC
MRLKHHNFIPRRALVAAAILATLASSATSQERYPAKPVTLVVGFAPGGGTDLIARVIAPRLSESLKQPVVVENRAGASGTIGAGAVAKARPDGYTLLLGHVSSNAMVPAIRPQMPYVASKDFTAISLIGSVPQVVVVPASSPAKTFADFVEMVKARKGAVNYASSGQGTQQHFAAELFQLATGTSMTHVPYKGSGSALTDLLSGQVDVNFDTVPTVLQYIRGGQLRALAVTTRSRVATLPNVPTVAESGVPGYEIGAWYMLMAPADLPKSVRDILASNMSKVLATPDVREKLAALGTEILGSTPEEAQAYLGTEISKWARVAAEKKINAE